MRGSHICLLFLIFWLRAWNFASSVQAQTYQLHLYQTEDGLPTNLIKSINQDAQGFIWVASDEGLSRFDGQKFVNFRKNLPSQYTKSLLRTQEDHLIAINDLGVLAIESRADTTLLETLLIGNKERVSGGEVFYPKTAFEDHQGQIWISEPASILKYKPSEIKRYPMPEELQTTIYLRSFEFAEIAKKRLIVASFTGALFYYDPMQDQMLPLAIGDYQMSGISSIINKDDYTLWIGESQGITEVVFDSDYRVQSIRRIIEIQDVSFLSTYTEGKLLIGTWYQGLYELKPLGSVYQLRPVVASQARVINHIHVDEENNLWISSDDGIELLRPNLFYPISLPENSPYIADIHSTKDQYLLASDGKSVYQIDLLEPLPEGKVIFNYPGNNILSLCTAQNKIWVGTSNARLVAIENGQSTELDLSSYGDAVFALYRDQQENLWACQYGSRQGAVRVSPRGEISYYGKKEGLNSLITVVKGDEIGNVYYGGIGTETYLYQYLPEQDRFQNLSLPIASSTELTLEVNDLYFPRVGEIWIATNQGLYIQRQGEVHRLDLGPDYSMKNIKAIAQDKRGNIWIGANFGVIRYREGKWVLFEKSDGLSTVTVSPRGILLTDQQHLLVATANGLNYAPSVPDTMKVTPAPVFLSLKMGEQDIDPETPAPNFTHNISLQAIIRALSFPNDEILYQYRLKGLDENWREISGNEILIQRIPAGDYQLEVRAKQRGNYVWSNLRTYAFRVERPWYQSTAAWVVYTVVLAVLVVLIIQVYTRRLRQQKLKLEKVVQERTHELEMRAVNLKEANDLLTQQKEEIGQRKESMEAQRDTIEAAYKIIQRKNRKIVDSIRYAKTIQQVILPTLAVMERSFKDHFLIFKPRDVVSGDFYWLLKVDNRWFVAVIDCTGHGVPGAFMSMIGHTLLYRIVKLKGIYKPAEILETLHAEVRVVLRQRYTSNADGMDVCLCVLENQPDAEKGYKTKVTFTGARRPLYFYHQDSLEVLDGDRKSIGGWQSKEKFFTEKQIWLNPGDAIYLSSDGLTDQNNPKRRKFGEHRLFRILEKNIHLSMPEQKTMLVEALKKHQQGTDQRDDITFLGIRI